MRFLLVTLKWIALLSVGAISAITVFLSGVTLYIAPELPSPESLRDAQLQTPLRIYSQEGALISEFGEKRRKPEKLANIPKTLVQAFLSAEDARFYEHSGVDFRGLARAASELILNGKIRTGGSTITMQLARNFFLTRDKTFIRKFNEILLAIQIERILSKDEILELYLNKIYLGHRSYGVVAAAEVYYGRPLSELSLAEMAMIAGLPKAPSRYNPISNAKRSVTRRNWIIDRMESLALISAEDAVSAKNAPVTAKYHKQNSEISAPYFAELVRKELEERFGEDAYTGGYKVYTTLNAARHQAAQIALQSGLMSYSMRHGFRKPEAFMNPDANYSLAEIQEALKPLDTIGPLHPAVITSVNETQAMAKLKDGRSVALPWETMKWARRYVSVNNLGPEIASPLDVLAKGYVVRIFPYGKGWALGQVPNVQGVLVSMNPSSGAIDTVIGGFDFFHNQFNRATQAKRQPGSNIKPFLYSAALAKGYTPASVINDAPVVRKDNDLEEAWRPRNAGGNFFGPTRLRVALYKSRNLVSIRLLEALGASTVREYLIETFGFTEDELPRDVTLALGSGVITPIKLAQAYAVLANGGFLVKPWFIKRIERADGELVYENSTISNKPETCYRITTEESEDTPSSADSDCKILERTMNAKVNYLVNNMLKDVITKGTARKARALERPDLAGKTGTTNNQVDAWFSGYNSQIVTTVWVGFDDPASLGRAEYGGKAALPIWMNYMKRVLPSIPEDAETIPPGIAQVKIDPSTGQEAAPGQADTIFEYFDELNLPPKASESIYKPGEGSDPDQDLVPAESLF